MKINSLFITLFLIFTLNHILFSQDIETSGRVTNSIYVFEGKKTDGTTGATTHTLLYQYLRFSAKARELNNLSFNVSARALTDLAQSLESEERFRAYRLSISMQNLFNNFLDFEIGRQFLHPGITLGSLDGANVNLKFTKQLNWQIYGGVETHLFRAFKIYEFDQAAVYGTKIKYRQLLNSDLELAYLHKRSNSVDQWQIAGFNFSNYSLEWIQFLGQLHYDLVNSRIHRIYFTTRFLPNHKWNLIFNYKQQYPQIYGDSFFKIFNVYQYHQAGISAGYAITDRYSINGRYNLIQLKEGQGHRAVVTLSDLNGSIGVFFEGGDLGNQLGVVLDYGYEFLPGLIASLSVDYSRYKFEEIYEYENQLANALRVVYKFAENWRVDLEYQLLNNRFKDSDHRVLNHIHFVW